MPEDDSQSNAACKDRATSRDSIAAPLIQDTRHNDSGEEMYLCTDIIAFYTQRFFLNWEIWTYTYLSTDPGHMLQRFLRGNIFAQKLLHFTPVFSWIMRYECILTYDKFIMSWCSRDNFRNKCNMSANERAGNLMTRPRRLSQRPCESRDEVFSG